MMGSLEEDIQAVDVLPEDMPEVVNDLDIEDEEIAIENREVRQVQHKLQRIWTFFTEL